MNPDRLTRRFIWLRALRWLPIGIVLPFLVITPDARGLSLSEIGFVFAVHSAVALVLEVPSGALADAVGRRRVMLAGAAITAIALTVFAFATSIGAFVVAVALIATGRALISGSLEAWYVDALRLIDPLAALGRGLSRGTAAEGLAMAAGALLGGAAVALAGVGDPDDVLSGYGLAALVAAGAALVYLAAVAAFVDEQPHPGSGEEHELAGTIGRRIRAVLATARAESRASVTVRVIFVTGAALGVSVTAVELLWQPRMAKLLGESADIGLALGTLGAVSMLAVAIGAGASPALHRRFGLRHAYLGAMLAGAGLIALLGAPQAPLAFAVVYLLGYCAFGVAEPLHVEMLNDAVGGEARATLISAESLFTQAGSLVANLAIGALAAAQGTATAFAIAAALLALTTIAVARPLRRGLAAA